MKKAYIVNYDLNNTKDYETLFAEIYTLGGKRVLKSCWLIMSSLSAKAIRTLLLNLFFTKQTNYGLNRKQCF